MQAKQNWEKESIYPFDEERKKTLLETASECTFNWVTKEGWPVGVIMSYLWHDGSIWVTAGGHRHRISAVRRDPRVSVVISGACHPDAPFGSLTCKGRAIVHDDQATKDWFYPMFTGKGQGDPAAAEAFRKQLDSPLRVIVQVIPEKWIEWDGTKVGLHAMGQLPDDQKGPELSSDAERWAAESERKGSS